jgi:hypothetical protein
MSNCLKQHNKDKKTQVVKAAIPKNISSKLNIKRYDTNVDSSGTIREQLKAPPILKMVG